MAKRTTAVQLFKPSLLVTVDRRISTVSSEICHSLPDFCVLFCELPDSPKSGPTQYLVLCQKDSEVKCTTTIPHSASSDAASKVRPYLDRCAA